MIDDVLQDRLHSLVHSPENPCFGCSPFNERGLHLEVRPDGDWVSAEFQAAEWQQG